MTLFDPHWWLKNWFEWENSSIYSVFSHNFPMIFPCFPYDCPMFSLWFPHDFPMISPWFSHVFGPWLVHFSWLPGSSPAFLPARRAFRCRRVWAAAVRSGTQYLRTVLGDARSEAGGDRRGPEGPRGARRGGDFIGISLQCGAPKIAKLVYNSNFTMVYGTYNELVNGVYKPTYNWGAPHCRENWWFFRDCTTWSYWLVVWNMFMFPFSWEFHNPNWRTPSFFRGIEINEQTRYKLL